MKILKTIQSGTLKESSLFTESRGELLDRPDGATEKSEEFLACTLWYY